MARVDYDRVAAAYQVGRAKTPDDLGAWRAVIAAHLPTTGGPVLDLGAGTGIWTRALGVWFGVPVLAVEPSLGMRRTGAASGVGPCGRYIAGRAEALPLADGTCRAVWLSTVVHHIGDLERAGREIRRVLSPGSPLLVRNSFPGRHDEIMLFEYLPGAGAVAEDFYSLEQLSERFDGAGLRFVGVQRVREPAPADMSEFRDWVSAMRSVDSALAPLDDAEIDEGLARIDRAIAAGVEPTPLGLDLAVFRAR
ncbi:MAG: class I SAM-dependent methyltransferase [Acidimicrobiales bacterium]